MPSKPEIDEIVKSDTWSVNRTYEAVIYKLPDSPHWSFTGTIEKDSFESALEARV